MTTTIEWPIGEPIATDIEGVTGTICWIGETGMSGYLTYTNPHCLAAAMWDKKGRSNDDSGRRLIPPKREPRMLDVWVDRRSGKVWTRYQMPPDGAVLHTLTNPDDREPITKKDIFDRLTGHTASVCAENVLNLLKERGYE